MKLSEEQKKATEKYRKFLEETGNKYLLNILNETIEELENEDED